MTFTLAGLARDLPAARRDVAALVAGNRRVTWGELDDRAARVASGLVAAGLAPGERVLILVHNAVELVEALLGCARAGMVAVPLNWRLAPEELHAVARDADPAVVLAGEELRDALPPLPGLRLRLVVGDGYEAWLAAQQPADHGRPDPSAVALLLYTSGTSGIPKGVLLSHANFAARTPRVADSWRLDARSTSLVATPLFHTGGIGWLLAGLHAGATQVLAGSASAEVLLHHLVDDAVTHVFLVPTMIQRLCDAAPAGLRFTALRLMLYGASPISARTQTAAQATFGCDLVQAYGMTETTGGFTQLEAGDHRGALLATAGRPYPWVEVSVRDPGTGRPVPDGEVGEIWTRSAQNTRGYFRRPEETAALLTPDGWLCTGDGGWQDAAGYLHLTDRVKDLIVTGGENVAPAVVERVLREHPDVLDVAVVGVPDADWGERVTAVVVSRPGTAPAEAELLAFAAGRLAGFQRPRAVHLVPELPHNATGKVLKRALRAALAPRPHKESS